MVIKLNRFSRATSAKFESVFCVLKMWSNEQSSALINSIEKNVLREIPVTITNNNHEFTGNLLDICSDWIEISNEINRSGELAKFCGTTKKTLL